MSLIKQEDRAEFVGQIIDIFEDFLASKGITDLKNDERGEDPDAAIIYGTDYGELQSGIEEITANWGLMKEDRS